MKKLTETEKIYGGLPRKDLMREIERLRQEVKELRGRTVDDFIRKLIEDHK